MGRGFLGIVLHCYIQMLKLVVPELFYDFTKEGNTGMIVGEPF